MDSSPNSMVSHRVENDILVLEIQTPYIRDPDVSQSLRDRLIEIVEQTKLRQVVVDFSKVEYVGSVGLLGFMSLRRHIPEGKIVFCALNNLTKTMFLTSRLIPRKPNDNAVFEEAATVEEALKQ